MTSTFESTGRK